MEREGVTSQASEPPLRLEVMALAPRLLEVRAALPASALMGEPDLVVGFRTGERFRFPEVPIDQPRIVILQRPALRGAESWRAVMREVIARGWLAVLEYDDHPKLVSQVTGRPPDWARFGWVHAVQTSTPRLERVFRPYNPEVKVFPNAVFQMKPFPAGQRPPRIFYGALGRGRFAVQVARALQPALAANPQAEVVVVGDKAVFEAMPTPAKRYFDVLPYADYLEEMSRCTIVLSPLEASALTEAKSDAKFLDAASVGALTISSPTVYAQTVRHGETGLIARNLADWPRLLGDALADPVACDAMARRAWDYVAAERLFGRQIADRKAWYRSLWERRAALHEGVIARLPGLKAALGAPA